MTADDRKRRTGSSKDEKASPEGRGQPLTPDETEFARNPAGTSGRGKTTAPETATPRQKETTNVPTDVVRGFTHTGVTGSTGGRADYGIGGDVEAEKKVTRAGDQRDEEKDED